MFSVFHKAEEQKTTFAHTLSNTAGEYIDRKIINEIIQKLSDAWVEEYRVAVMKEISPVQVKEAVEKHIGDTFAKNFLNR